MNPEWPPGDAAVAMDYRLAADMLNRFAKDLNPAATTMPGITRLYDSKGLATGPTRSTQPLPTYAIHHSRH